MRDNDWYLCGNVFAVVVTYNPDLDSLNLLLHSLVPQVNRVIIIDNGSTNEMRTWLPIYETIECLYLDENMGISAAQNMGIKIAMDHSDMDFVLLSDQDSEPERDMVRKLRDKAQLLMDAGSKVAALGPCYVDTRQDNPPPFLKVQGLRVNRQWLPKEVSHVAVDYLIASGCLIPIQTLKQVGMMNESMFIDYVDIEWGLRAKSMGFKSYGDYRAKMHHSLGENPIVFNGKSYPVHSPLRHYYHVRNAVWLYKQPYIPLNWKIVDGYKLLLKFGFYTLFGKPRMQHFQMMLKGMYHGVISRLGPAS